MENIEKQEIKKSPVKPVEIKKRKSFNIEISFGGVSHSDILFFTKHVGVALKSGLTIIEGLEIVEDQAKGKLKKILANIIQITKSGQPFHIALEKYKKYFSPLYINMVKMGEVSGNLEENLEHLAEHMAKTYELKKKVKSVMIYPSFVMIALVGLGLAVATYVFPKILPLFRTIDLKLPLSTRLLIFVAEIFDKYGLYISLATIAIVFVIIAILRLDAVKPITHRIIIRIPIIKNIIKNFNLASFTRTFGILLASGIPVDESLRNSSDAINNRAYKSAILSFIPEVRKGNNISDAILNYPNLFPKITSHMIHVGESTGNLDELLKYLSDYYEQEVDSAMKNLSSILEPVLLIFIGLAVATVAVAIISPIYQITGGINR